MGEGIEGTNIKHWFGSRMKKGSFEKVKYERMNELKRRFFVVYWVDIGVFKIHFLKHIIEDILFVISFVLLRLDIFGLWNEEWDYEEKLGFRNAFFSDNDPIWSELINFNKII